MLYALTAVDGHVFCVSRDVCLGADVLRLSREDLLLICGLADGIRLYNALHVR